MKTWGIILLLLFIVLFGSVAFVVYQKGFPTEWARLKIISSLEQGMNIRVKVDSVAFGFPNRVIINGLSISPLQNQWSVVSGQWSAVSNQHSAISSQQSAGEICSLHEMGQGLESKDQRQVQTKRSVHNPIPSTSSHKPLQEPPVSTPNKSPSAYNHPLVKVKQITIKCHLWDIILKRHPSSYGIDKIIIDSSELYLSRYSNGVWNTEGIFKPGRPKPHSPPEFSLFTKNSKIIFQDYYIDDRTNTDASFAKGVTPTVLYEIRATYVNGRFKANALFGDGIRSGSLTPLHCSGVIHAMSPFDMNWDIGIKKTNLSRYSPYLKLPFGQVLDGDVWVNLRGRASCLEVSTKNKTIQTGIKIGEYTFYGLSGQVGVQDGRFLLKNARLPFNQINGVIRLTSENRGTEAVGVACKSMHRVGQTTDSAHPASLSLSNKGINQIPKTLPVTTIKTDGLSAVLCDTEIKTIFVVPDINNPETLLTIETSRVDVSTLKYLTNINKLRDYFSKSKLKTSLKFNARITPYPFLVSGKIKMNNIFGKENFLAEAGFVFKDNVFDCIDIDIDKKTSIKGFLSASSFSSTSPFNLVIECRRARVIPLLGLSGVKGTPEFENGNISGRLTIRPNNYEGRLTMDTSGAFQRAVLTLKGQKVEAAITQAQGGSITALCQWLPSLKIDASVRDFTWNHSKYSLDAMWNTTNLEQYKQSGELMFSNVTINQVAYPSWHGRLSYGDRAIQIDSQSPQNLLINGGISMDRADINIGFVGLRLDILHPALNGIANGKIQLTGNPFKRLTISGQGIDMKDNNLICGEGNDSHAIVNLSITKRENIISISSLSFTQPNEENPSNSGKAYISGFVTTSDKGISSASLNTQITNLLVNNVRATVTAKYNGRGFKGNIVFAKGCIGKFDISSGRIEINRKKNTNIFSGNICVGDKGMLACSGEWDSNLIIKSSFTLNGIGFNELPWDYFHEWHGSAILQGKIEGHIGKPCFTAKFTSSNLIIGTRDVKNLSGNLYYVSNRLLVDANFDNELFFSGIIGEETKANIKIERGRLSLLSRILRLPPLRLNGLINGNLSLTGKMDNPCVDGDVIIKNFESHGIFADMIKVKFNIKDKVFSIARDVTSVRGAASSQLYCQQDGVTRLIIEKCTVELVPDGRISFEAVANSFQVANITLSGTVSCNGNATIGKSASVMVSTSNIVVNDSYDLKNLAVLVKFLNDESLEFIQQSAENSVIGKISFAYKDKDKVFIEGFSLLRQGRRILEITGWTNLSTKKMDVGIIMDKADLALLSLYVPTIKKAEGIVNGGLHFSGLMNDPEINGSLKFSGSLNTYPFAARVRDMNGEIHVINNSIIIRDISANIGKGRLIATSEGAFTLSDMNISVLTQGAPIPILVPEFIESHGRYGGLELNMNISGAVSSPLITGQISVSNTDFTYPPKKTRTVPTGFFDKMRWDVTIISKDNIRYYNDYTNICLKKDAYIRVVKNNEQFDITGKIFAREGGIIDYLGTNFILKEGCLEFRDGEPSPYLSIMAWARIGKRKVSLSYQGYLYKTEFVLNATGYPPLNQEEIMKMLLSRSEEYATLNQDDMQTLFSVAGGQILGKKIPDAILVPIERRISRLLRIDLEVKTPAIKKMLEQTIFGEGTSTSSSVFAKTSIKVGKFIQENLYISYEGVLNPVIKEDILVQSYRMRLANEIGLEYYLSNNTTIKYKFIPRYNQAKAEYEISMERGLRF